MLLYAPERTAVFIDGANLYATVKTLGIELDYRKLLKYFQDKTHLVRAFYYTAIYEDAEYTPLRPLVDWLDYNGFTVVTKPVREFTDAEGRKKIKGNMDIEIAVDMLELTPALDHAILFSGDGDFVPLIHAIKKKGVRTTVVSAAEISPPMVADTLRRAADQFVELKTLKDAFGRKFEGPKGKTPDPMAFEPFKMT
jgi:uncharacterized LabA/DUF88 family protein